MVALDSTDLELCERVSIPPMQTNRAAACAVNFGNNLLVAGGDKSSETRSTVEVYNGDSKVWSYVSSLPQIQCEVKSATMHSDGNLYRETPKKITYTTHLQDCYLPIQRKNLISNGRISSHTIRIQSSCLLACALISPHIMTT